MKTDRLAAAYDREVWSRRANEIRARIPVSKVVGRIVTLRKAGGELIGLCPFHNESTPSFTVSDKKRFFHCFGCGEHGDAIAFVMRRQGLAFQQAVELLEGENGLRLLELARPAAPPPQVAQKQDLDKAARVCRMWERAQPIAKGDPVDRYLRGRGLVPPADYLSDWPMAGDSGWPDDLRFDPKCWHGDLRVELPAMVAGMRRDGELTAVHRTYLKVTGIGVTKAGTDKDKAMYGDARGAWIRLAPIGDRMIGGEGIETSLSAGQLSRRAPLAFASRGTMAKLELPFEIADFWYAADRNKTHPDPKRSRVGEAAAFAGRDLNKAGRAIAIKVPRLPPWHPLGDFNDQLQIQLGLKAPADERRVA